LRLAAAATLAALLLLAAGCGGGDDDATEATPAPPAATTSASGCRASELPTPRPEAAEEKPTAKLDPEKTYELVVDTNCGSFTIELNLESAPNTTASLVALARNGYFDDLTFHRIVPGFVIQGGDPTGTGGGGPGYTTVDTPPPGAAYTKGIVAMAKTPVEPPGTSGSQFFVVTADDAGLPPDYAIVGEVVDGLEVVERIGTLGDQTTEQPLEPIVIEKVVVRES
jgi:cyclophilin family peptidyl-prolyl cis-trans isomerase